MKNKISFFKALSTLSALSALSTLSLGAAEYSAGTFNWNSHLMFRYTADKSTGAVDSFSLHKAYVNAYFKPMPELTAHLRLALNRLHVQREGLGRAYLDYQPLKYWHFQAGLIPMPMIREIYLFEPELDLLGRSQTVLRLFSNEPGNADTGLAALGRWRQFDGGVALVNGSGPNIADNTEAKTFVSRLAVNFEGLRLGGYAYTGDQILPRRAYPVTKNRFGGELCIGAQDQNLRAEYHRGQDETTLSQGWFIQADMILGIFSPEAYRKWEWLQRFRPIIRFESFDPDIKTLNNRQTTTSVALHYSPSTLGLSEAPAGTRSSAQGAVIRLSAQYDAKREEDQKNQLRNNVFTAQIQVQF
ncbi:MAG: hypothetical protein HY747_03120 [Elusimicrobia bacterium]|nr:hypothetical protein [Elusimicrobiota bacterium]